MFRLGTLRNPWLLTLLACLALAGVTFTLNLPTQIKMGEKGQKAIQMLDDMRRPLLAIKEAKVRLIGTGDAKSAASDFAKAVESGNALLAQYQQLAQYNPELSRRVTELSEVYEEWVATERHVFDHLSGLLPGENDPASKEHTFEKMFIASSSFISIMNQLGEGEIPIHADIDSGSRATRIFLSLLGALFLFLIGLIYLQQHAKTRRLEKAHNELESQFEMHTADLREANRSLQEITERKQAEAQLKQANAKLARRETALQDTLADLRESHEQLKAAQSQLIQAEKLESVGTLAAGVAHEVKNPLTIILQGIYYLSKHLPANGDNAAMALQDMNDAVKRANSVVTGLLDFSSSSDSSLNTEELNSVVEQSLSLVRHELTKCRVNAVRELSEHLPPVRLDRNKIEQVFVNVFLNAIYAMPEGGTLTVKTYSKQLTEVIRDVGSRKADHFKIGETVVMADVEDTGAGIPKDKLSEVFDPFFTTKSTGKGTGLGLTVTKKIINLHGGTIDIGNRKEGGARVTIMFKA